MPMSSYHASLVDDLNRFWTTGELTEGSELNALAQRCHAGDVMQAVLNAAAQITVKATEAVSPSKDVLFIEYIENIIGEVAVSRLYALPESYVKDLRSEDIDIIHILEKAEDDLGGDLEPIHQMSRLMARHTEPDTFSISGWTTEGEMDV